MADKKSKVLIVEDEMGIRELLKLKLSNEGFNILEAENGKMGLEIALKEKPDLILLDIIMPIMDGISMLGELRNDEWGKKVPVIILSNLSDAEKINEGIEKSVYDYLVKSDWEPDNVVALIRKKLVSRK